MKFRMFITMLLAVLLLSGLSGCALARAEERLDAAGEILEERMDAAEDAIQNAVAPTGGSQNILTKEQAQAIALEHAGFTADQVQYLRTEYEIDDGIPQYEVQFHQDRWEYDYEINAETGAILSYDRDD